jgi:hypothetical protein
MFSDNRKEKRWVLCLMQVLWPGFLGAIVSVGVLFSLVDPLEIEIVNNYLGGRRLAAYTMGFLLLWFTTTIACLLTWVLTARPN